QVDFTIIRLGHNPLLAFVATLGWSRATFVKFDSNQDSAAWCDGIESALRFFGGTPHQLLFDNAKAIMSGISSKWAACVQVSRWCMSAS
ncbi:transposase, partial [Candidatus Erwinia dacicola]|nr:transposase [Candidatus Erwinia dacicola]